MNLWAVLHFVTEDLTIACTVVQLICSPHRNSLLYSIQRVLLLSANRLRFSEGLRVTSESASICIQSGIDVVCLSWVTLTSFDRDDIDALNSSRGAKWPLIRYLSAEEGAKWKHPVVSPPPCGLISSSVWIDEDRGSVCRKRRWKASHYWVVCPLAERLPWGWRPALHERHFVGRNKARSRGPCANYSLWRRYWTNHGRDKSVTKGRTIGGLLADVSRS